MDYDYNKENRTVSDYIDGEAKRDSWRIVATNLMSDIRVLMGREKELVRTEMREKVSEAKKATVSMAIAGALFFVGLFALVATSIILLDKVMDLGLAAGIVTAILFVFGAVLFFYGKKKLTADNLMPKQSIETIGEMTNSFKERFNEYKSTTHH